MSYVTYLGPTAPTPAPMHGGAPGKDGINGTGAVHSVNSKAGDVVLGWLDIAGTIPTSKIPAAALTIPTVVANQAAMLALDAQQGDVAIRADNQTAYMLAANGNPTVLADWLAISTPGGVTSVNGQAGVVVLAAGDVGAAAAARILTAGTGLSGGGDLTANRSFAVVYGTTAGTAAQGNDARFVGVPVSTKTAAYSLVAGDAGSIVEVNSASAVNVTVPASVFAAGQIVEVCQIGAGQVTIVAGSGVTLRAANGLKIAAQYGSASIRFRSAAEAVVAGAMTT